MQLVQLEEIGVLRVPAGLNHDTRGNFHLDLPHSPPNRIPAHTVNWRLPLLWKTGSRIPNCSCGAISPNYRWKRTGYYYYFRRCHKFPVISIHNYIISCHSTHPSAFVLRLLKVTLRDPESLNPCSTSAFLGDSYIFYPQASSPFDSINFYLNLPFICFLVWLTR